MIARAPDTTKGDVENLEAFLGALGKVEVSTPHGRVSLDQFHNPVQNIHLMKTERKGDALQNTVIATYPSLTQFWTWTPAQFMAMTPYLDMRGRWAR